MKVKLFEATIATVTMRFFLMMLVAGLALTTSVVPLIFIALPIFLTAILGIKFEWTPKVKVNTKLVTFNQKNIIQKAA